LKNLAGESGGVSVQSVNGFGDAVGTVAGKAVEWLLPPSNDPLPISITPIDLNGYASKNVTLSRGIDINDYHTILAGDVDSSGNVSTYLLTQ